MPDTAGIMPTPHSRAAINSSGLKHAWVTTSRGRRCSAERCLRTWRLYDMNRTPRLIAPLPTLVGAEFAEGPPRPHGTCHRVRILNNHAFQMPRVSACSSDLSIMRSGWYGKPF